MLCSQVLQTVPTVVHKYCKHCQLLCTLQNRRTCCMHKVCKHCRLLCTSITHSTDCCAHCKTEGRLSYAVLCTVLAMWVILCNVPSSNLPWTTVSVSCSTTVVPVATRTVYPMCNSLIPCVRTLSHSHDSLSSVAERYKSNAIKKQLEMQCS